MEQQAAEERGWQRRVRRAALQVLLLVVMVPVGIAAGWQAVSPAPADLAARAARGADVPALLELVQRAECEEAAAAELLRLLEQDPAAVRELAAQAAGHEVALRYLLFLARRQPDLLEFLEGLEMSYPFALGLLQQMNPAGMQTLEEHARGCSATAVFMQAVAYENGCHVPQDWAEAASRYHTALELGCEQALPYLGRAAYEAGLSTAGDAELADRKSVV